VGGGSIDLLGPIGLWGGVLLGRLCAEMLDLFVFFVSALGVVGLVHHPGVWALFLEGGLLACFLVVKKGG